MFKPGVGNVNLSQTTGEFTVISPLSLKIEIKHFQQFRDKKRTFDKIYGPK